MSHKIKKKKFLCIQNVYNLNLYLSWFQHLNLVSVNCLSVFPDTVKLFPSAIALQCLIGAIINTMLDSFTKSLNTRDKTKITTTMCVCVCMCVRYIYIKLCQHFTFPATISFKWMFEVMSDLCICHTVHLVVEEFSVHMICV